MEITIVSATQTFSCECGSTAHETSFDPARGRVRRCLACGLVTMPDLNPDVASAPTEHTDPASALQLEFNDVAFVGAGPKRKSRERSAAAGRQPRSVQRVSGKPLDVLGMARKRLRELNAEIKRLRKLEQERDKLERLLRAADGKPVAVVANLRTAKGA